MKVFFVKYNDPIYIKLEKLDIMIRLTSQANIAQVGVCLFVLDLLVYYPCRFATYGVPYLYVNNFYNPQNLLFMTFSWYNCGPRNSHLENFAHVHLNYIYIYLLLPLLSFFSDSCFM